MDQRLLPTWCDPDDVLDSAVKHVATHSSRFDRAGIYSPRGDVRELGGVWPSPGKQP